MAGLVPAIHVFSAASGIKTWMPGLKPGMTASLRPDSTTENPAMPDSFAELRHELAVANRILANEGIIDAFGHISVRNPKDPNRYFISRHRASELVEPSDILEMTLDSKPVVPTNVRLYSEMVIHGEIYKVRPDVNSVCHHHAPSVLPFCATGVELVPLFHLGGTLGEKVPFWDSRDEFGDTNLLVRTPEEGASHARALGPHYMLLLRRHGASLAGKSLRECVFRSIYSTRNAELQLRAMAIGTLGPLSPGEVEKCGGHNLGSRGVERAWEYWVTRLQKAEAMWTAAGLPRLKDLGKLARPQRAGLAPARSASRSEPRVKSRAAPRKRQGHRSR
jgi:ribulose-5-phosphate 4-epimerase/fuculose-1-phosphate aldolase